MRKRQRKKNIRKFYLGLFKRFCDSSGWEYKRLYRKIRFKSQSVKWVDPIKDIKAYQLLDRMAARPTTFSSFCDKTLNNLNYRVEERGDD